mmetsp:Transcript_28980/g.68077  ORF Transcript_28980/g.68077 Transcript_28980/m.68077 type:complete len:122 (+) Transcript_28980:1713-2078(+)|eukprot:CAMPEP_0172356060 /NCGR_PEP_ID=MMETSP1060-20121228/380_1 /TAXON_ID=37318 /ORGANISM="Pseudo-nitzschia pungens, Strain cf. cingulata" /LENGTH=121 /DNA_ID=CAMNT_0013075943 /DNA_START=65 /DNA_END=430 /DNA_ORIENTATION=-
MSPPSANPTTGKSHYAEKTKLHEGLLKPYAHEELGTADDTGRAKDPVKYLLSTEQRARERQVAYETVRLLREDVIECYRKSGVNHYTECKEINQKYFDLVTKKDMGQLHPNWKNAEKFDGW